MHCPLGIATAPQRQFICEATWVNPTSDVPAMADLAEGVYIRPHEKVFKVGAALAADHVNFSTDEAGPITEREKEKVKNGFSLHCANGHRALRLPMCKPKSLFMIGR